MLINPYWDAIADLVTDNHPFGRVVDQWPHNKPEPQINRHHLVAAYSWTITDPETVEFVATHANGSMVDPMAGTGYWAYLLGQLGIDVVCSDKAPGNNVYHSGSKLFVPIETIEGSIAVARHPDRTLLLSWPPYDTSDGFDTLSAYKGRRVIFMGEAGGCTGDEQLHDLLNLKWVVIGEHRPIQWYGLHDYVTVYRKGGEDE